MADRNKAEQEASGRQAPAGAPVLAVEDLSIRFDGLPEGLSLVDGLSFSVEAGRTLCLVGGAASHNQTELVLWKFVSRQLPNCCCWRPAGRPTPLRVGKL